MAVFFTYLFNVFAIALPGMDFAPFKKPQASSWGFSHTAALFLAFPVKSCFATFHGAPQGTLCSDLRVFFLACTPDENRPMVSECTSLPSKYLTCGQDISQCAALYLGPRAALAGGWPRNAPAGAVLAIPMKSCSTTFHGGQDFPSELDGFFYLPIDLKALLHFPLR